MGIVDNELIRVQTSSQDHLIVTQGNKKDWFILGRVISTGSRTFRPSNSLESSCSSLHS